MIHDHLQLNCSFLIPAIVIIASMRLLAQLYDKIKINITINFITQSEIKSNWLIARSLERRIIEARESIARKFKRSNEIYRNFYFNRIVR